MTYKKLDLQNIKMKQTCLQKIVAHILTVEPSSLSMSFMS